MTKEEWKEYNKKRKDYLKQYHIKNKKKRNEYNVEYRIKNNEKVNEYTKNYKLKNPHLQRHYEAVRRTRIKNSTKNIKLVKEFYKNCPEGYEVDHIIPLSKGGLHSVENLQYLTPKENRIKKDRIYA